MDSSQVFPKWLVPLAEAVRDAGDRPVIVLCRTSGQARSLRRLVAGAGGLLGVQIVAPSAFVLLCTPPRLSGESGAEPPEEQRPDCQLLRLIGERARFLEHSREWARCVRLHLQAGGARAEIPDSLLELAETDWGKTDEEEAISSLLDRLSEASGPDQARDLVGVGSVLSHGYLDMPQGIDAADWERTFLTRWLPGEDKLPTPFVPAPLWERKLLRLLGADPLLSQETPAGHTEKDAIPGLLVPDVAAEARLAASLLRERKGGDGQPIVLVPDASTADRLRDAGLRNQLPIAETEAVSLSRHPLARVVRLSGNWFSGDKDPLVRASHLQRVLGDRLVGQAFPGHTLAALEQRVAGLFADCDEEFPARPLHLSGRRLTAAIVNARIVEAPLSQWIEQLASQAAMEAPDGIVADEKSRFHRTAVQAAILLEARLRLLQACVTGQPWNKEDDTEPEATEHMERGHIGRELDETGEPEDQHQSAVAKTPAPGSFGALRRFLVHCTLQVRDDPAGKAVMAALREHRLESVSGPAVETVLAGSSQTGVLAYGVEVMQYDEYDGRPSGLLLLLGIHNKGIARAPSPDPLAHDDVLASVGRYGGRERVKFRLLQALRAVSVADNAVALVSQRDETGRVVVPPVELSIDLAAGPASLPSGLSAGQVETDSFGLHVDKLPETGNRDVLERKESAAAAHEAAPSAPGDNHREAWLAVQASAEWYRAGRGTGMPMLANQEVEDSRVAPLSKLLEKTGQLVPDWVEKYLGIVPETETGRLDPSRSWSVSSYFTPLTHCLYQLFAFRVLGLRELDEISDSLLPREVGNAVHGALEKLGCKIRWQAADEDEAAKAREEAVALLCNGTKEEFDNQLQKMGHVPAATTAAAEGTGKRWDNRWPEYAESRIRTVEQMETRATGLVNSALAKLPEFEEACRLLDSHYDDWVLKNKGDRKKRFRTWLCWAFVASTSGIELTKITDEKELLGGQGSITSKIRGTKDLKGRMLAFVAKPAFATLLAKAADKVNEVRTAAGAVSGNHVESWAEQPFGRRRTSDAELPSAEIGVAFKGTTLSTHGVIDSLRRMAATGKTALQIVDYKAGKAYSRGELSMGLQSMRLPQLAVYALAMQGLVDRGVSPVELPEGSVVGSIAYDYLQGDSSKGLSEFLVSRELLAEYRAVLSALLERAEQGDWSLAPHPDECPVLCGQYGGDYCPFHAGCRFEAYPEVPSLADEKTEEDDA